MSEQRVPASTYRVQLHSGFTFDDAAAVVPYLAELGVTHLYCSPWLQAAPGSTHGYDVVDHSRLNDELGGHPAYDRLRQALRAHGLGCVLDIVPNHTAVSEPQTQNPAWWDVLKHGRGSQHRHWFDIDGDRPLVPVLGDQLGACLERNEISYDDAGDEPVVRYYDQVLPVAPGTEQHRHDLLALLDAQHYRLCHWRLATEELNYRRFFDITTLAGLRVEDDDVFDQTHALILEQVRRGEVDGLRVDHPDGLADPVGYLRRLSQATDGTWTVVEKILEHGEQLPQSWSCAGTTGYDALNRITGLFVDPAGEGPLTTLYGELTSTTLASGSAEPSSYDEVVDVSKRLVLRDVLGSEVGRLTDLARAVCTQLPAHRDHPRRSLHEALTEVLAAFRVYRAYVTPGQPADDTARALLDGAARQASHLAPRRTAEIELIADLALGALTDSADAREFVTRFQQTCGPVMAKGVEDTAFYRYFRLVALNEVGGDPGRFGTSVDEWHEACLAGQRDWPLSMTTLSTHDTKRSEDVRARLVLLSQLPRQWGEAVTRWTGAAARFRDGGRPDRNAEYLLWQTLVGAWPISADRALAYVAKAAREAKVHTSWTEPDRRYDDALAAFVRGVLADEALTADIAGFVAELTPAARITSAAQKLVQLTMPGVPDVYQGSELEDLSLVDPDNRRPVDYEARRAALAALEGAAATTELLKPLVVSRALRLRREHPGWFGATASYTPIEVTGDALAFSRADQVVTVVPLRAAAVENEGWGGATVTLPEGGWRDVLSGTTTDGGQVPLEELLDALPLALLVRARS